VKPLNHLSIRQSGVISFLKAEIALMTTPWESAEVGQHISHGILTLGLKVCDRAR